MNDEELQLLRENNILLKQILSILQSNSNGQYLRAFLIDVLANRVADNMQ